VQLWRRRDGRPGLHRGRPGLPELRALRGIRVRNGERLRALRERFGVRFGQRFGDGPGERERFRLRDGSGDGGTPDASMSKGDAADDAQADTGGMACTAGATRCASSALQTCAAGTWQTTATCAKNDGFAPRRLGQLAATVDGRGRA
jgi:hypothetical protein